MMLDHYQQTKNLLVSYSNKAQGFSEPRLRAHRSVEAAQYGRNRWATNSGTR